MLYLLLSLVFGQRGDVRLLTRLRPVDFRQEDAVVAGFIRPSVVRENNHPLRFAKQIFGSGFEARLEAGDFRLEARAPARGATRFIRDRGRGCEDRPETGGCRLERLPASQGAKESVENFGGFGRDWEEFRMPREAEESESVSEADLVFDLAG